MIARKPSVFIYKCQDDGAYLNEICAGIEEEGVFFDITNSNCGAPSDMAADAASSSVMGVGIGICDNLAVLCVKGQPRGEWIDCIKISDLQACRQLGQNAGRYVKKSPLNI